MNATIGHDYRHPNPKIGFAVVLREMSNTAKFEWRIQRFCPKGKPGAHTHATTKRVADWLLARYGYTIPDKGAVTRAMMESL